MYANIYDKYLIWAKAMLKMIRRKAEVKVTAVFAVKKHIQIYSFAKVSSE